MKNCLRAKPTFVGGLFTALFLLSSPIQATTLVGSTPGSFSVSQSGAANYSIPIQVPPGIAGMSPELSLVYSSQSGNGLLGLGWNLAGLSLITRCPATKAQDGFIDGVDFDSNDKFCLDGQRLMPLSSSPTTGSDSCGSYTEEYRTEINTFSRIRSYGTAGTGGGPASFCVTTRSGQIMEYGLSSSPNDELLNSASSPASRVEAQGRSDVLVWALNKVKDTSGNYLTVSYTEDAANGEFRPKRIDYTGNTGQSVATYASVQFTYNSGTRPDTILHYMGGSRKKTTKRLLNVKTYVGSTLVKDYRLSYGGYGSANLSRLLSVTECDGQTTPQCLPPTEFQWKAETTGFINSTAFNLAEALRDYDFSNSGIQRGVLIDINGDGLADHITAYNQNLQGFTTTRVTRLNTGSGWQVSSSYALPTVMRAYTSTVPQGVRHGELIDVNGDGLPDWVYAYKATNGTVLNGTYLNTGSGWGNGASFGQLPSVITDYANLTTGERLGEFADVNGDGLVDWVLAYENTGGSTTKKTYLNTGSGWDNGTNFGVLPTVITDYDVINSGERKGEFVDVNGDGLPDWVLAYKTTAGVSHIETYLNTGSGWDGGGNFPDLPSVITDYDTLNSGERQGEFADVNGDGLPDWVRAYRNTGGTDYRTTYLNTGSGWDNGSNFVGAMAPLLNDYDWVSAGERNGELVDINGDGLVDYVRAFKSNFGTVVQQAYLNTGSGWGANNTNYALPDYIADYHALAGGLRRGDFADLNGDGIKDWVRAYIDTAGTQYLDTRLSQSNKPGLIVKITSGLGTEIDISYKYLTDGTVYTKGTGSSYPVVDLQNPVCVVSQVAADNGIGGDLIKNFTYTGLKYHYLRGWLGFASMTTVETDTENKTITNYNQVFPYTGRPSRIEKRKSNNDLIGSVQYAYDEQTISGLGYHNCSPVSGVPVECARVEENYDFDSATLLTTTTTATTYDSYINPDQVTVTTVGNGQTFVTETDNTFNNDIDNNPATWLVGLLTRSEVQKTLPNLTTSPVQTIAFDYVSTTGLLLREIIEPGSTNQNMRLTTAYVRDNFGNITRSTLCDGAITPSNCTHTSSGARSTQFAYASGSSHPIGLFATTVTNALNQAETRVYDVKFGGLTSLTGPNGLVTAWGYDTLGRKILETRADSTQTQIAYAYCTTCPTVGSTTAKYSVTTTVTGAAPEVVFFDALNREIRRQTTGFDGTYSRVDTKYDARGRISSVSEPYFTGGNSFWTEYTYDDIDRVVELDPPHTTKTIITDYNGFSTKVTTRMTSPIPDQIKVQVVNAIGQIVSVTEADEVTTVYRYDAAGNLEETEINDVDATIIHMDYDVRGRKTGMTDPDMGGWSYSYNAFGELISQTDAKSQVTTMQYDKLGRMTQRVDDATGSPQTSTWTWGTSAASKNIGKLASMSGPGGTSQSFLYDSVGRPSQTTYNIDMDSFVVQQSYDSASRPDITTYPVTTKYPSGFKARRVYNTHGYLEKVQTTDATPFVFWQATAMNARGQVKDFSFGNGIDTGRIYNEATGWLLGTQAVNSSLNVIYDTAYTYDEVGNLKIRTDYLPNPDLVETFTYDDLNRLLTSDRSDQAAKTYAYDDLGNIISKAGVTLTYNGCGSRPHALCSDSTNSYAYDANGNMTSRGSKSVTYTAFNLPYEFKNGGAVLASFAYDAERNRVLKIAGSLRVRYVGMTDTGNPLFEQEVNGSTTRNIHYIYADGAQAVAQHISIGSTVETQYFHRDHLGSVEATSDDVSTPNMDYIGYDAWGSRIVSPDAENIRLGFTGHETISEQAPDLVHMNGRVYDPAIGRFLTADPLIPDPFSSQSFNRYSYVSNNPLSYSDPSGYREENGQRDEQEKVNGWVDEFGNEYKMVRFGNPPCPFPPDCRQNGIPIPPMPLPYPEPELPDIGFRFIPALPDIGIQMTGLHGYQNISYSQYMFDAQSTSHIGQYPAAQTFGLTTPAWTSSINPDPGTVVINQRGATSSMMGDSSGFTPGTPGDLGAPFPLAEVLIGGAVFKGAGPFQQWFRLKGSYSHTLGAKTALSLSWGASKAKNGKYVDEITSPMWRRINQWLRELRIPGSSWRTQDPGHFHIKPPPSD